MKTPVITRFPIPRCSRCGSKLIEVKRKSEKSAGQQSPVTTIVYKCSDKSCQAEIDRKMAELRKRRKEQEALAEQRLKAKAAAATVTSS